MHMWGDMPSYNIYGALLNCCTEPSVVDCRVKATRRWSFQEAHFCRALDYNLDGALLVQWYVHTMGTAWHFETKEAENLPDKDQCFVGWILNIAYNGNTFRSLCFIVSNDATEWAFIVQTYFFSTLWFAYITSAACIPQEKGTKWIEQREIDPLKWALFMRSTRAIRIHCYFYAH